MNNLIERIKSVAGQDFDSYGCRVRNPHITARQSIEIANYIVELEQERNELAAQVERLMVIPYTKTRAEFMESWGVDGMSADKKRLANAAWDRAEWFFNQQAALLKAQWQADILAEISLQVSASKPVATPIQIATAIMKESNNIRNSAQEQPNEY